MVYTQYRIYPRNEIRKSILRDFEIQMDYWIPTWRIDLKPINKNKITSQLVILLFQQIIE